MIITTLPLGQLEANCYVVIDEETNKAMIIDPGDEPERIKEAIEGADVQYIVLTHAHFDHAGAVAELKESTGAAIIIHEAEVDTYNSISKQGTMWGFQVPDLPKPDILIKEADELAIGSLLFSIIHTPGHSPGGICIFGEGSLFTGDTLFAGSVGRTDFPGGSHAELKQSFRRLMSLPDDTPVFSGHGPATSIGHEKVNNMFATEFLG
jgi:hydroxyacylglutathione hydrolase